MLRARFVLPAAALFVLTLGACQQQATEDTGAAMSDSTATASAEAQIDSFRMRYVDAWNARDWGTIQGMMSADYHEVGPEGEFDHDQAVAAMQDSTQMPPPDARISITANQIAASGDVGYASGTSTVTATGPDGQPMTQSMDWVAGFKKVGDQWKIDRLALVPPGGMGQAEPAGDSDSDDSSM